MRRFLPTLLLLPALAGAAAPAKVTDPETGLATWRLEQAGLEFTLAQLLPDQVRAFFQGRGFDAAGSERLAAACVFQAVVRNRAPYGAPVTVALGEWDVRTPGGPPRAPRTAAAWIADWGEPALARAQHLALRWALLPAEQRYAPGDWNMGMLTLDLPAGATFDLVARWRHDGQPGQATLSGMRCAEDRLR